MGYRYDTGKTGKAHLHLLDDRPLIGTSGIVKIISNIPGWWASGLAVKEFGVTDPKLLTKIKNGQATEAEVDELKTSLSKKRQEIVESDIDFYLSLCDSAYRAHDTSLKESADEGTDLHAELERFVKDRIEGFDIDKPVKPYHRRIQPFIDWYVLNVKTPLWSEMHCYSREYWLGGICDFGFIDNQDRLGIMDFKSAKKAYPGHFWQCAGYDIEFSENGGVLPDGTKVFDLPKPVDYYTVLPFGMEKPVPQFDAKNEFDYVIVNGFDTQRCKEAFLECYSLYKKLKVERY